MAQTSILISGLGKDLAIFVFQHFKVTLAIILNLEELRVDHPHLAGRGRAGEAADAAVQDEVLPEAEAEEEVVVEEIDLEEEAMVEADSEEAPPDDEIAAEGEVVDDGLLYVVEERIIRRHPARILSDGTVEAETAEGWMRFENLEHLDEYLDAVEPPRS
jgi:hypothetical protein